jgi:L-threonylcarbamoyladenylate synthase
MIPTSLAESQRILLSMPQLSMPQVSLTDLIAAAQSHRLISFPTDTVPALAVAPIAADLIYAAKQRDRTKPLILMAGELNALWDYVQGTPTELAIWQDTAATYLPGAVTFVLPASDRLPPQINPTDTHPKTIGIRVPNHALARNILRQTGALATTSINRSGEPPLMAIADINQQFPDVFTLSEAEFPEYFNSSPPGVPSTVIQWTNQGWKVLRQGVVWVDVERG